MADLLDAANHAAKLLEHALEDGRSNVLRVRASQAMEELKATVEQDKQRRKSEGDDDGRNR